MVRGGGVTAKQLFARKSRASLLAEAEGSKLKRTLGPFSLTAIGIAGIIGAGIFFLAGEAARDYAGPSISLSFVVAGVVSVFAALCFAELASMVPVAGGAYNYAYASMGEFTAWLVAWSLIIEYTIGNIAVAGAWTGYFSDLLAGFGVNLPEYLLHAPGEVEGVATVMNLPALLVTIVVTTVLVVGIRESAAFNNFLVLFKLGVIALVLFGGISYVRPENWTPFAPAGARGVITGAGFIFFAYIGFDVVSTAAEEARNPKRDVPLGILLSLFVCALIFVAMSLVLTGMVPYAEIDVDAPFAEAFRRQGQDWLAFLISLGATAAITTVLLAFQLGQPRIFMAMARDGLLPQWMRRIHPRFRTPWLSTLMAGSFVGLGSAFLPVGDAANITNLGTLFAFAIVCAGVSILRRSDPKAPRGFRVPFRDLIPFLGVLGTVGLMFTQEPLIWAYFVAWLAVGLVVYGFYGMRHSKLGRAAAAERTHSARR